MSGSVPLSAAAAGTAPRVRPFLTLDLFARAARAARAARVLPLALRVEALRFDALRLAFFLVVVVALLAAGATAGASAVVTGAGALAAALAAAHSGVG